jgi:hypothetical protein
MTTRVSLAELAASDIRLRPGEAVAIVSAICDQHMAGTIPGIPSPGVIRLTRGGDVLAEGPITTSRDDVARAALLLNDLLSGFDGLPEYRASGALRLVIARALGTIDLPPYASLPDFCSALSRFATHEVRDVAQGLFTAWERAHAARDLSADGGAELTISDVRRARRATGLSLHYVAAVAELPPTRLRDLEWGYMRDWPATTEGRAQVIRYARAAGLDEAIVLSIAWPMIVEGSAAVEVQQTPVVALVRSGPQAMTAVRPAALPAAAGSRQRRRMFIAAAAAAALLGAFAAGWALSSAAAPPLPSPPRHQALQVGLSGRQAPPIMIVPREMPAGLASSSTGEAEPAPADARSARAEVQPSSVESRPRAAVPKAKSRRAPVPSPRHEPRKTPFFERELFRIVIR